MSLPWIQFTRPQRYLQAPMPLTLTASCASILYLIYSKLFI